MRSPKYQKRKKKEKEKNNKKKGRMMEQKRSKRFTKIKILFYKGLGGRRQGA